MAFDSKLTSSDPDSFDVRGTFRRAWRATRRFKGTVILTCGLTLLLIALYIHYWPPIYIASSSIMSERVIDPARDEFYTNWDVFRKEDPQTEIELMTAGPVLAEVIHREHLSYKDVYHPFMSQAVYLWETSFVGRMYRSIKKAILGADDTGGLTPAQIEFAKTLTDFRAGISVEPVGESNIGMVTVKGPTRRVAEITNTLVAVYLRQRADRHVGEAQQSLGVLDEQTKEAAKQLHDAEQNRLAFSNQHSLTFDLQKENLEVSKLTDLESTIAATRSQVASLQASLAEVTKQLAAQPAMKTTSTVSELNAVRENIKLKRVDLQAALIQARERYLPDSPEVQELVHDLAQLDALESKQAERVEQATTSGVNPIQQELLSRKENLETQLAGAQAALKVTEETAQELRPRLAMVPAIQAQLKDLDRNISIAQQKYQGILLKHAEAQVSVATARAATPSLHVVDTASEPSKAYWPKTKYLYLGGIVMGLLLGFFAAQVRNAMSGRIQREDFEDESAAIPLYATIPIQPWDNRFQAVRTRG
jgi:uncharacterized protein involved in exopolysaccharide biosynthesis